MKRSRVLVHSAFLSAVVVAALTIHAALQLRSFLAISHPVNHDVLLYLGWMLRSHDGLRWFGGFDYLSGLGISDFWNPSWIDPISIVLRATPIGETFFWYRFVVVLFAVGVTYAAGVVLADAIVGQIAAIGVTVFAFLPSRFSHMHAIDFSGPGFVMLMFGWTIQMLVAFGYLSKSGSNRQLLGFGVLGVLIMAWSNIWQTMYLYLALMSLLSLLMSIVGSHQSIATARKVLKLASVLIVSLTIHLLLLTSTVPLSFFSARKTSESVSTSAEVKAVDFLDQIMARGPLSFLILGLAFIGVMFGIRDEDTRLRTVVRFWLCLTILVALYVFAYAPMMNRGIEIGMNPEYFMQVLTPLTWVVAAFGIYRVLQFASFHRGFFIPYYTMGPALIAILLPLVWNLKNAETRATSVWPAIAQPPRVFSELRNSFFGYEIPTTARVFLIQDDTSYLSSFDELFFDFVTLRKSNQSFFNTYSGFVRPWSAEFVSSFVFDGELRHSSITATKASPVAFELLGIDHVISREPIVIAGAQRVAERPDGVGLYRLAAGNRWFADAYEVEPNLAEHVAVLQAQETAAESWSGGRLRAVLYESIGQIVQPTTSKVRIEREKITVSGTTSGTSLLTLPIEFSTCNRWKSLSGVDARPVVVNGFFQGYVVSGEFAGEITRNTRGLGQVVCETRDYMRWRSINAEN